jgi:hypothetical protein
LGCSSDDDAEGIVMEEARLEVAGVYITNSGFLVSSVETVLSE